MTSTLPPESLGQAYILPSAAVTSAFHSPAKLIVDAVFVAGSMIATAVCEADVA